ncbi:hypothetical protein T492DRAFT_317005 [Pavlovales sp. CCMP2436]|nr:hypothetical protein T492DRAFT_317005 [Pavlovales sp. CCMP2436]
MCSPQSQVRNPWHFFALALTLALVLSTQTYSPQSHVRNPCLPDALTPWHPLPATATLPATRCLRSLLAHKIAHHPPPHALRIDFGIGHWTGIQVCSADFLEGVDKGRTGLGYGSRAGLCLETQKWPDCVNHPDWPSAEMRPGSPMKSTTIYAFSASVSSTEHGC